MKATELILKAALLDLLAIRRQVVELNAVCRPARVPVSHINRAIKRVQDARRRAR